MYIVKYSSTRSELPEKYYKLRTPGIVIYLEGERIKSTLDLFEVKKRSRRDREFLRSFEKDGHFIDCCNYACKGDPFFADEVVALDAQLNCGVVTRLATQGELSPNTQIKALSIDVDYWQNEFEKIKNFKGVPDQTKMRELTKRFRYCLDLCVYSNNKEMQENIMDAVNNSPDVLANLKEQVYPVVEKIKEQNRIIDKKAPDLPVLTKIK